MNSMRRLRSDEELLAYYTSFLKTVSMKLNERTVQFFFHTHKEKPSFPLYCEAIKLFRHPESMVRAAIRTLTLNVFAVPGTPPPRDAAPVPRVHPTSAFSAVCRWEVVVSVEVHVGRCGMYVGRCRTFRYVAVGAQMTR